jgi:hypothetical protein
MLFTICTEENPQVNEIEFILKHIGCPYKVTKIIPCVTNDNWNGTFIVETDPSITVIIILVKGSGSFVDYIVYDHLNPDETSVPILLMESTKTSDIESRNTSINQRFTKFAVVKQRFPTTDLVMYYNTIQTGKTATNHFGKKLLKSYGVKAYDVTGKDLLKDIVPFTSVDDLIKEKNSIKEKKGNVSVKITQLEHTYTIQAKLSKGKNTTICHDPNIGFITGIASVIHVMDKEASFIVTNHCVDLATLNKPTSKFWYANSLYSLTLEGCSISTKGIVSPIQYWSKDTKSVKASTVIYQLYMEKYNWTTIYHNHNSSARSYFTDQHGKEHQVPKDITIPHVVMVHTETKQIQVCEGKIMKDLTNFLTYLKLHYDGYSVELGRCLYGESVKEFGVELLYPVFFGLDSKGMLYY